jgi:hypothetical protein
MHVERLSADTRRFLVEDVHSVMHLELVLLLHAMLIICGRRRRGARAEGGLALA